jgi:hypothetical protein
MKDFNPAIKEVVEAVKGFSKWLVDEISNLWAKIKKIVYNQMNVPVYKALVQLSTAARLNAYATSVNRALKEAKGRSQ